MACGCTARPAPQLPLTLTTPAAPTSTLAATPRPIVTATALRLPTLPVTRTISQQRAYSLTLQVTETPTPFPEAISAPPIDSPIPEVVNTPLPGDGSLKPPGQHAYSVDLNIVGANGVTHTETISYLLYLPGAYGQDPQQWPLILFLHGSGERGDDPEMVAAGGLPKLLTSTLDFPAVVLSPQVQEEKVWWGAELDLARALLDHVQANYAVDPKRVYLTGLSLGGFGAWALALRYPRRFAALVPIAGGWDSERDTLPRNICDIKDMPIWVFHGQQDDIVLPKKSELMVNALRKCGSAVRFTLYPDANHRASFERAYREPDLYTWLFEQHLP